jgi:hypothetical protein
MTRWTCALLMMLAGVHASAQTEEIKDIPRKGSYLYYGQPAFEDNSFLLNEAINQEKGIMQYISEFYFDNLKGGNFLYSFTHEIPLGGEKHQLSYTLFYYLQNASANRGGGFGDVNLNYSFRATGKKAWAMVVPSITLIIPTGKNGYGSGGVGGQAELRVTKRLSRRLVTHYNFGYTYISSADFYISTVTGSQVVGFERDIQYKNVGAGLTWYPRRKINVFLEYVSNFLTDVTASGSLSETHQLTLNPGLRFAIDHNLLQIVPGLSAPVVFTDGRYARTGLFFYLSLEPQYLPFSKMKHR